MAYIAVGLQQLNQPTRQLSTHYSILLTGLKLFYLKRDTLLGLLLLKQTGGFLLL